MSQLMDQAIRKIKQLPERDQDVLASIINKRSSPSTDGTSCSPGLIPPT